MRSQQTTSPLVEPAAPAWLVQMIKFSLVGVLNTLIDAGVYFCLTRWLGMGSLLVLAKALAYIAGMINSFYWNRTWTFSSESDVWKAAGLFTLTHIGALGVNAGVMALSLNQLALPELYCLGLATGVTYIWNFTLNKMVVFKQ